MAQTSDSRHRRNVISVRLSDRELEILMASAQNQPISTYLRSSGLALSAANGHQ